jgi:hypothetical protein
MEFLHKMLPLLVPILVLQLGLQIYSLINLAKRKNINKWIWMTVIIVGGIAGPMVYLLARGAEE